MEMIEDGDFCSGGLIPAERELARTLQTARGTLRKAISRLVSDGKLIRRPRVGTIVSPSVGRNTPHQMWGVIVPILHYFYPLLVSYLEREAERRGAFIQLACSYDDPRREREHMDRMIESGAKGIILAHSLPCKLNNTPDNLSALPVPVILLDHWGKSLPSSGVDSVLSDDFAGCYQSTLHMIRHGYRKISFPHGSKPSLYTQERYNGYRTALKDHGISVPPEDLGTLTNLQIRHKNADVLRKHLDWGTEAIVTSNDNTACELIRLLEDLGVRVPRDVGVIGYDDDSICTKINPMLTTVRVPKQEMACRAAEMLAERIRRNEPHGRHRSIVLRPIVVARQSCALNCADYHPENNETEMELAAQKFYLRQTV